MIPSIQHLETSAVLLRPMVASDVEAFLPLCSQDENMWSFFTMNLSSPPQLKRWVETALRDRETGNRLPFTIIDKQSGAIAGSTSIANISMYDLRAEIGWSWLGQAFRGTGINRHAKYAMMRVLFDSYEFERVEFKTDVLNERARQGLLRIGAVEEGILRSHMKMWNNRRRTSIYYSVLKSEWPRLKATIFAGFD